MAHLKTQTEWETEMSIKILDFTRNELYMDLRFMNLALSSLIPQADSSLQTFATDGITLRFSPEHILRVFKQNPAFLPRIYLHCILHCIFAHLWMSGNRNRMIWNLSCDIAVEYTIDTMQIPCTKRILSWIRQQVYDNLKKSQQPVCAAVIYQILLNRNEEQLISLQSEFYTDSHRFWPTQDAQFSSVVYQAEKRWQKIARQTQMQQEQLGKNQTNQEHLLAQQLKANRSRRSYRDFLKRFSVLREELHCDPEEFDLNYYTYGLRIYKNMPLIEPLETRETKKIREFVIVVDTSYSTSGELVKNFLRETFQILHQRKYFFQSCKIRILQCDNEVRMDQEITDLEQFERMIGKFTIIGGGGTNFCPAFTYVNELTRQGIFKNLGGLLYFTDGQGIYPKKRPPYQTAFLFLEDYDETKVPPWAMRLRLEPQEFIVSQTDYGRHYEY